MKIILIDFMLSALNEEDKILDKCLKLFNKSEKYRTDKKLIQEIEDTLQYGGFSNVIISYIPDNIEYKIERNVCFGRDIVHIIEE